MQSREPYGKPMFEPIWEAAATHGLRVAVHINGGNGVDYPPTFAGHAHTYPGYAAFMPLNYFVHLATLIVEGVFGRHPGLKFVFADGGYDILTPLMWRLDTFWLSMRYQTPWVDHYPSEYLPAHVRFCSSAFDGPTDVGQMQRWMDFTNTADLLMYPYMAQVLMTPQTRGTPFGNPHFDPLYEAASRNGLPVATHLMGQTPFELVPLYPVGNRVHWHDFFASWPLLYVSHLMSLVFDGAFDRHPDLRVVFIEGGFSWAMPVMSRMDRIWEARRADLPHVRRRPSEYGEHVRFTTQPLEDADVRQFREYLEMMDLGDNLMFSTDYPHWSYDSPAYAINRFPAAHRERIMRGNATALYRLPATVKALPGEQPPVGVSFE
jgi:predicted TIM-barrel fold metal-dependent hydrolase